MPINEALFWIGITVFGTGAYILWDRHLKSLPGSISLIVLGALAIVYSVYLHSHPNAPDPPLWALLVALAWVALGYLVYMRAKYGPSATKPQNQVFEVPPVVQIKPSLETRQGTPPNAAELVWNWRRMVINAYNVAREEKITFAEALVKDASYSDLRQHLREVVRDAIEGVPIGNVQGILPTVDPLFKSVSDDIARKAQEWNLPTEPIAEETKLIEALETCRAELQAERERYARPVIAVTCGNTETSWQKGFRLVYSGADDPLMNVTIKPISTGDYTATFETIPFLHKGVPAYLIPEVKIESEPHVRGELKSLFEYSDLLTGVIKFSVVSHGPRPFEVNYRVEGHYAHDVITVFPEA